jgi:hypothetical protein
VFRFALVSTDGESLGPVAYAGSDFKPDDVIPHGKGRSLRVVNVIELDADDQVRVPVVELAEE